MSDPLTAQTALADSCDGDRPGGRPMGPDEAADGKTAGDERHIRPTWRRLVDRRSTPADHASATLVIGHHHILDSRTRPTPAPTGRRRRRCPGYDRPWPPRTVPSRSSTATRPPSQDLGTATDQTRCSASSMLISPCVIISPTASSSASTGPSRPSAREARDLQGEPLGRPRHPAADGPSRGGRDDQDPDRRPGRDRGRRPIATLAEEAAAHRRPVRHGRSRRRLSCATRTSRSYNRRVSDYALYDEPASSSARVASVGVRPIPRCANDNSDVPGAAGEKTAASSSRIRRDRWDLRTPRRADASGEPPPTRTPSASTSS